MKRSLPPRAGGTPLEGRLLPALGMLFTACSVACLSSDFNSDLRDEDGDNWFAGEGEGFDCDDGDPATSPGQLEICGNQIDNDCDGLPDGDPLPWSAQLNTDLDDGWSCMVGDAAVVTDEGILVAATPLVLARHPGADCWGLVETSRGYRLSAGWTFEREASFELELIALASKDWEPGAARPSDGYALTWIRRGEQGSEYWLWRLNDGQESLIGYATWEPRYGDYDDWPYLMLEVLADDQATTLAVKSPALGHNDIIIRTDRSHERHSKGGIGVGAVSTEHGGTLTGVYLDPL
jgi:hypothetical protein